jgi:hypothetical protein
VILLVQMFQDWFHVLDINPIEELADQPFLGIQLMFVALEIARFGSLDSNDDSNANSIRLMI